MYVFVGCIARSAGTAESVECAGLCCYEEKVTKGSLPYRVPFLFLGAGIHVLFANWTRGEKKYWSVGMGGGECSGADLENGCVVLWTRFSNKFRCAGVSRIRGYNYPSEKPVQEKHTWTKHFILSDIASPESGTCIGYWIGLVRGRALLEVIHLSKHTCYSQYKTKWPQCLQAKPVYWHALDLQLKRNSLLFISPHKFEFYGVSFLTLLEAKLGN